MAVGRSSADSQQPPPRQLDQGAVPRTGGEAAPRTPRVTGHWRRPQHTLGGRVLVPTLQTGSSATRPRQCRKQAGTQGSVPGTRGTLPTQPQGRPLRKRNALQSAMAGGGGGGVQSVRPAHRTEPQPPHQGGPQRVRAPGSTATRTLDSSWGGCASLNPLPMLSQGPPRSKCSPGRPPPTPTSPSPGAHGSPPGPDTGRRWFTQALPAPTTPYVQGREGCSCSKATMQGHGPLPVRAPWECGGVGA